MKHNEGDEAQDDFEFEITSLDETDGDAPHVARLPEKPVFFLRTHRKLVTAATTGVVVLAILLIVFSIAPIRQLFTPTVEQTTFYYRLDANPPWGHLFVDGQAVKMTSSEAYPLFTLTRGKHTLLWRADPFSPQQCVAMVPVGSGIDTCKHPEIQFGSSAGADSYISFPANLSLLSTEQRYALLQATQAAFDSQQSSELMRVGDLYAQTAETTGPDAPLCTVLQVAALCLADAHQPLNATLRLQLDTVSWSHIPCSRGACESNGQNCHLFCDIFQYDAPDTSVSPTIWQAYVYVQLFWRFSTLNGQVVADNQADTFIRGQQNDIALPLNITWNGRQWRVSITMIGDYSYASDPVCNAAMGDLYNLENAVPATTGQDIQTSMNPVRGTTLASGCLIEFKLQTDASSLPTPTAPPLVAHVIQRFGVLLAVDSAAHRLFPFLPVASAYEKQLARQWAILQPVVKDVLMVRQGS
ncbi:MAG TPA: hypothetical protein VFQ36_25540 [Ktedonobacteraceae bacterium]|nr:hypothetical protein [Ktedonobacteraceae bacterium]